MDSAGPARIYFGTTCDAFGWGGGLTAAQSTARACADRGAWVRLIGVGPDRTGAPSESLERMNLPPSAPGPRWRIADWRRTAVLAAQLRALPPPGGFVAVSPFLVCAARRAWPNVPVIYLFPCLLTHCLPFTWANAAPPDLWTRLNWHATRKVERQALLEARRTFAATTLGVDELTRFSPAARGRIAQQYFGARRWSSAPAAADALRHALAWPDDALIALAVGVFDRNKALDEAIRAVAATQRWRLALIGDGPERPRLEQLILQLGVGARVHLGAARPDLAAWYANADCVISTSFYDTFPNVLTDAVASGVPVIVPQHDPPRVWAGFDEVIVQYGGGRRYDRTRRGALADVLLELEHDPDQRDRIARETAAAAAVLSWDGLARRVLDELDLRASRPTPARSHRRVPAAVGV